MRLIGLPGCVALAAVLAQGAEAQPRNLTFEQRVRAQGAIERVYYAHQIGVTRPFEEAVPRAVLEKKVRTYLSESVALDTFWKTPVTSDMLRRELERIAAQTRMPERLRELYAALNNDTFLIQECLARPALVDRLARNFFAYDQTIHAKTRREAGRLLADLVRGRIDLRSDRPGWTVLDVVREDAAAPTRGVDDGAPPGTGGDGEPLRLELTSEKFEAYRSRLPAEVGEAGPVQEGRETFSIQAVLETSENEIKVASFVTPKMSWDEWWASVEGGLEPQAVEAVASSSVLPLPRSEESAGSPTASCLSANDWRGTRSGAEGGYLPEERTRHTAVWTGSLMVVWGGHGIGSPLSTGGRYDPATDTWTPVSETNAPTPREGHTAVWTGGLMVVWGGQDYSGAANTGGRYDPVVDTWLPTSTTNAPSGRHDHAAVWTGSVMVVWGGYDGSYSRSGGRYDPVTDVWTSMSSNNAPSGRLRPTGVWTGGLMIVWGGADALGAVNTGGRYDPVTDVWSSMSLINAPLPRYQHASVWTGSLMIVWGGYDGFGELGTGGRYDPASDVWSATSMTNAPAGRFRHTGVWTGGLMIVWGGFNAFGALNTGGRYDPVADVWTSMSSAGAPSVRYEHTVVWTGSLMIVWGGSGGVSNLNTGGRYDPAAGTWTPTSTNYAPLGRSGHSAVWTGNLMIIWGGFGYDTPYDQTTLHSGSRYNPVFDTWSATADAFPPVLPRYNHTAIWTGNLMIIWGGNTGSLLTANTGGRYDPIADAWTPTSMANVPAPRLFATAVWTGSRMVVWGGYVLTGVFNTGGRYDPSTDSWLPTSTGPNVPDARFHHTAIWTGTEMIVWGGGYSDNNGAHYLNTGGRYDPSSDTWTRTSTANAPSGRSDHATVWTGAEMIVWGGWDGSIPLNTGGRYNPARNAWTPVTVTGAPAARNDQTALWTGTVVIEWGGGTTSGLTNTGGRYDPAADSWTPMCARNAPSPRVYYAAVWTGNEMIVWGGQNPTPYELLATGGRYSIGPGIDADGDCFTECQGDCDDGNATVYPAAPELCDGLDNDCDGSTDGFPTACGVGQCASTGWCASGTDSCVPGAPSTEACDGVDNNCDGIVDNAADADGDGYNACRDCDDSNPAVHPGGYEVCDNLDNNCDGRVDDFYTSCGMGECYSTGICESGVNSCVPGTPTVEICDGLDNDCDGLIDNVALPVGSPAVEIDPSAQTYLLSWGAMTDATSYDVVYGDLGTLSASAGDFTTAVGGCAAEHVVASVVTLGTDPGPGQGYFYLVRGANCSGLGTYDSGDPGQAGSRDAEVNASSLACWYSVCGNRVCESAEDSNTCPDDCPSYTCGNNECDAWDTCINCPQDCGSCPCGDGYCDWGETCFNCPADCGPC